MGFGWILLAIIAGLALWIYTDFLLGRKKHLASAKTNTLPIRESNLSIFTEGPKLFADLFSELNKVLNSPFRKCPNCLTCFIPRRCATTGKLP